MWDEEVKSLLDTLPVGVLTVSGRNELTGANRAGLASLGLDEMAVGYGTLPELIENEDLKKAISARPNGVVRLSFPRAGRTYHAELRPDPEGEPGARLLLVRDVTGVSNMAILRRHFVFDLLHKLRTPLTTILSVLAMATSGRLDPTRADFNEILGMGARQAERLTGLLSRLKDLFLLETGGLKDELQIQAVPIADLVKEVARSLKPRALEKGQTLLEDYPTEPSLAAVDRETVGRVVEMVLMNALSFTPETGEIRLIVKASDEEIRIAIQDNGPGISEEELPIVFDRFRRGNSPVIRAVEGEGLGLYLARQILLLQSGTILIDSKLGEGTTVEITLPPIEEDS